VSVGFICAGLINVAGLYYEFVPYENGWHEVFAIIAILANFFFLYRWMMDLLRVVNEKKFGTIFNKFHLKKPTLGRFLFPNDPEMNNRLVADEKKPNDTERGALFTNNNINTEAQLIGDGT